MIGGIQIIDLTSRRVLKSYGASENATDYTDANRSKEKDPIREIRG
jgi:hypothetical protein